MSALRAAQESLAACDLEALTHRELLGVLDELESMSYQLPAQWHRALARLQAETTPKELGAKNWKDVLWIRWRISATEANRRLAEAAMLGPRRTLTGEPLAPVLAANGGWTTTINEHGDTEWAPPPDLDTGQARINYFHRPELLLRPPEEPDGNSERGP